LGENQGLLVPHRGAIAQQVSAKTCRRDKKIRNFLSLLHLRCGIFQLRDRAKNEHLETYLVLICFGAVWLTRFSRFDLDFNDIFIFSMLFEIRENNNANTNKFNVNFNCVK